MTSPSAFMSYSHKPDDHKAWVLKLAQDLVSSGVNVILDEWNLSAGEDTVAFMIDGIAGSDRVLLVCSER